MPMLIPFPWHSFCSQIPWAILWGRQKWDESWMQRGISSFLSTLLGSYGIPGMVKWYSNKGTLLRVAITGVGSPLSTAPLGFLQSQLARHFKRP
jgi:hypothetical protein